MWKKEEIDNQRGQTLAALSLSAGPGNKGWVVVCHGFTGSKEGGGKSLQMAETLAEWTGFSFVLFDFAGNGESGGRFEDLTLSGQIADLTAVVDWCHQQGRSPVVGMGRSFGGSTVLAQAAQDLRVRAACTWAAPADLVGLFRDVVMPDPDNEEMVLLADAEGTVSMKRSFLVDLKQHDLLASAAHITPRPLLILHGDNDDLVPSADAEQLSSAAGEPKELHIITGADHQFSTTPERVWTLVGNWLQRIGDTL